MLKPISEMRICVPPSEASRQQLTALVAQLQRARERERSELAQQVHDELTQNLTAASMELSLAQMTLRASACAESKETGEGLARVQKLVAEAIRATQGITAQLRPKMFRSDPDHWTVIRTERPLEKAPR